MAGRSLVPLLLLSLLSLGPGAARSSALPPPPPPPPHSFAVNSPLAAQQVALGAPPTADAAETKWLAPHDVQGSSWLSPFDKQHVDVEGIVTATSIYGFYIQSVEFDDNDATSEGLYVYGAQSASSVAVGDLVQLTATVSEYAAAPTGLHLTELVFPSRLTVVSHGHAVRAVVLGVDRVPPGERIFKKDQYELNEGVDVELDTGRLEVEAQGLAFWESFEGMLVTIPSPRAVARTNYMGDVWVVGAAYATHGNARGGLTLGLYDDGDETTWDSNPEAILLWKALDGTRNPPNIVMGTTFENITGVVSYMNGSPVLFPLEGLKIVNLPETTYPPSQLKGDGACQVTLANYNVENLNPRSRTIPQLAEHIVRWLNLPDVIGLEEIQDNSGARNDGTTAADQTFKALTDAIEKLSGGVKYAWLDIAPKNNEDGGQPGGNIRPGLLYRTDRVELDPYSPRGRNDEAQYFILDEATGETTFALNPGLINPKDAAWHGSRKPLTASLLFKGATGKRKRLHVIVAHFSSKRGSGLPTGRVQTAANGAVDERIAQAEVVDGFVRDMLALDPDAHIAFLADANEFSHVQPLKVLERHMVELLVEDPVERYSFSYDQNAQQIDHVAVVPSLLPNSQAEILHLSTWTANRSPLQASDHDPVLVRINVC